VKLLLDYWFAYQLGKLPPRHQPPAMAGAAKICRSVASGGQVPPGDLYQAQNYAAAMWVKVVTAAVVLFILQESAAVLFFHAHRRQVVANTGLVWLALAAAAMLQVALLVWRTRWTSQYLARTADGRSLPRLLQRASRPHGRDFWLMLAIAAAIAAGVYAG
jgi:hypothetical protein